VLIKIENTALVYAYVHAKENSYNIKINTTREPNINSYLI